MAFIAFNTFVNIRGIQMSRGVDWSSSSSRDRGRGRVRRFGTNPRVGRRRRGRLRPRPDLPAGSRWTRTSWRRASPSRRFPSRASTVLHAGRGNARALRRTSARASSSHCPSSSSCSWRRPTSPPSCSPGLGGHRSRHMGFFDSVYLVGGPVFYKIMLLVNIVAVGIANIINAQMASAPAVQHGPRRRTRVRQGASVPDRRGSPHLLGRDHAVPGASRCRTTWARWRAS